jgi:hypothetical protein
VDYIQVGMLLALHWPTLEQLNQYTGPFQNAPNGVWVGIAVFLGIIAGMHAKERERLEQSAYSEARGWQYSNDWSPIRDQDWKQLRERVAGIEGTRKDFIWGTTTGCFCGQSNLAGYFAARRRSNL